MAIEVLTKKWNTKNELLLSNVIKGELSSVKRLVERGIADINYKSKHGHSCLQLAIIHGHFKLAEYLLHRGIDMHSIDSEGWTALHDAALRNSKTLARKLISKGCSTTQATNMGELPIDLAGSVHMEKFLCKQMSSRGERELALQYCVYLGLHCLGDADSFPLDELEDSQPVSVHRRSKTKEPGVSKSSQKTGGSTSVGVHSNDLTRLHETTQKREVNSASQTRSSRLECAIIDRPPPPYESRYRPREALVINSLSQHSCKSQLQDFDSFRASLSISKSDLVKDSCDSPKVNRSRLQQSEAHTDSPILSRRVHFATATEPMARTKVAHSYGSPAEKKESSRSSDNTIGLSLEEVVHLTEIYAEGRGTVTSPTSTSASSDSDPEVVAQLRMRPRKSSIASPDRRHSGGKRRSVTFQPEVLLQDIVTVGDVKEVHEVLSSGMIPDVNKMSPAGLTALHQSAIDGNLECAKALVTNGANVNSVDCEKWTPLHAAAMTGHADLVIFLLQSGADATLKNEDGETAYDIAKTSPIRKMLLCTMNGKNEVEFSDGEYSGEEEEEYSHAESDSDSGEDNGLFGSSNEERKQSLKERLGLNHSVALKNITRDSSVSPSPDLDPSSDSVFIISKSPEPVFNFPRRVRELTDSTSSCGSLLENIRETDERTLNTESDTDKVSEDQGISTMEGGSSDCSHRGRTTSEDEGTSRDFLDSELEPGSLDYRFQEAVLYCDVDSVLKLVKHKSEIDVDRVNKKSGITALHHTVLEENFVIVQHLVKDFGASLHVKDTDGYTPLHAASAVGSLRIAQFLLDNGAKPSVLNNSCEFPVDLAEDKAMEKLLKNAMLGPGVGKLFKGIFT